MRKIYITTILLLAVLSGFSQTLPKGFAEGEKALVPFYKQLPSEKAIQTPPSVPVRSAAEWEEMQGIVISWQAYPDILTEITRHGVEQGRVYIVTQNQSSVSSQLTSEGIALDSVVFLNEPSNSIWIRDYGPNNIYAQNVDSLMFVDWEYNRPRPYDDEIPVALADYLDIPLYQTLQDPYHVVGTGGNFMSDGFGTGFSSELILEESYWLTEAELNDIFQQFMGIDEYILMETLPYDGIHHIDMHMKLLDEETLLVGEYPEGVADGPQINANLQYVLDNYQTVFGDEFKVIRIPMPADDGSYPDAYGDYQTHTNSLIFNELILVPIYNGSTDSLALEIYREAMPGYEVVGIDCEGIISLSGAIHCITHELGAESPLLISHQHLTSATAQNENYQVTAYLEHRSGIEAANILYRTDSASDFISVAMAQDADSAELWHGTFPFYTKDSVTVQYYIQAEANNGKTQVRPMTAPEGFWTYNTANPVNEPPVANAGADQDVDAIDTVYLDGSMSYDPNDDSLSYSWTTNAQFTLNNPTAVYPNFNAPDVDSIETFEVYLTVSDGTLDSEPDTVNITVNPGISAKEVAIEKNWKIYPNPAKSHIYFAFANGAPDLIRIMNTSGQVMLTEEPVNGYKVFKMNIDNFKPGLYLVQSVTGNQISNKRLIIK